MCPSAHQRNPVSRHQRHISPSAEDHLGHLGIREKVCNISSHHESSCYSHSLHKGHEWQIAGHYGEDETPPSPHRLSDGEKARESDGTRRTFCVWKIKVCVEVIDELLRFSSRPYSQGQKGVTLPSEIRAKGPCLSSLRLPRRWWTLLAWACWRPEKKIVMNL